MGELGKAALDSVCGVLSDLPTGRGSPALVRAFFAHFARPAGREEQRAVLRALLIGDRSGTPLVLRLGFLAWPQTLLIASLAAEQGYRVEVRSGADQLFP